MKKLQVINMGTIMLILSRIDLHHERTFFVCCSNFAVDTYLVAPFVTS